jgi:hypothetical protein
MCPGLVVTASGAGAQLTLESPTGEDNSKWNFHSDGLIESVATGCALQNFGSSIDLSSLVLRTKTDDSNDIDIGSVGVRGTFEALNNGDIIVTGSGSGELQSS